MRNAPISAEAEVLITWLDAERQTCCLAKACTQCRHDRGNVGCDTPLEKNDVSNIKGGFEAKLQTHRQIKDGSPTLS